MPLVGKRGGSGSQEASQGVAAIDEQYTASREILVRSRLKRRALNNAEISGVRASTSKLLRKLSRGRC
jgi:hypothetical protein